VFNLEFVLDFCIECLLNSNVEWVLNLNAGMGDCLDVSIWRCDFAFSNPPDSRPVVYYARAGTSPARATCGCCERETLIDFKTEEVSRSWYSRPVVAWGKIYFSVYIGAFSLFVLSVRSLCSHHDADKRFNIFEWT